MNERSKKFLDALNADFRALSNETRKKFHPVKEAAEAGILKLRNLPAIYQSDKDIYRVLSEETEIIQPFLLGCDTKSLRVVQICLTALQRLISHQAISEVSAQNLISTLWLLMETGLEELRILQTLLLVLTTTKIVTGDSLSKAIVLCFKLYFFKDATISSTAAASVRQIASAVFERVVYEDTTDEEAKTTDKPSSPRHKNCPVSLRPFARDAYLLFQDLCQLTSGEQPYWLVGMDEMMRTFGLELLENILKSFPNIFLKHPEFSFLLKERVCPLVIKLFSPSIKFRQGPNASTEPPLEKPVFPVSMRLLRIVSVLIEQFYTLLVTECEIFLSLLVKFLDIDKPFWQRSLALEVLHILCLQPKLLRSFCQYYDMQEHSTKVFHDLVNSLASFIQSLYSGAGQQSSSSVTPPHSPSSPPGSASQSSSGNTPANTGVSPVPGFQYHGVWLPLVKLPAGQAKPVYLDQLDRVDTPNVPEAYAMTVAFKTLLSLVNSIDALVKSTLTKEELKVEGWIEPTEETKTPDKTGVGTEAVQRREGDKDNELNEIWKQMLNSSWCGLLAALSLLLEASNDESATEGILKCYRILSNSCGLLDLTFPRDAFIMSICKASLPSQCSLSVLSVPSLNSVPPITNHKTPLPSQETGSNHKPVTKTGSNSSGSNFPTMVTYMAQGAHNGPVSLSSKNIRCMRAILNLAHCHGGILGSSWYILLATLKHLTWMLGLRPSEGGSLKPGPISEIPNLVVSSSLKTEIPVLSAMLSRLFESSRFLDDVAVHHLIDALCRLMSEAADQAETNKDPSLFPIAKLLETGLHNLHRIPVLWKPLTAHLLEVCHNRHTRMREYGAESVTTLVCAALNYDHKPPLVANSQLQAMILLPIQDMSTNSNADVRNKQLECVLQILQSIGQNLGTGWPAILGVVGAATNQKGSAIIHAGFQSLQLIVTDFLPMMPYANLRLVIDVAGKYGLQPQELNISLTAVGLLWNISDFLNQNRVAIKEALEKEESQVVESTRDEPALPVSDRLWMALYSKMGELCVDPRPAVRKSAGQTLFSTISAHGSLLEKVTWYTVLWQVLFPLLERVKTMSSAAASVPPPSDTASQGRILMHHSRDTAEKQWDETRVLSLNGVARVFNTRRQLLASLEEFPRAWALLLEFIEASALSKSAEVSLAALKSFLDIVQDPNPDDEPKQPEAVFNAQSGNFVSKGRTKLKVKPKFCEANEDINLWINAWRVWHNIGVTSTLAAHTMRVKKDSNGQLVKYRVYPNQSFLAALTDVFPYLFPRIYSRFGLSDLQKLSQVLLSSLKVPVHVDSAPFLTTMQDSTLTSLQISISSALDMLREPILGHGSVLDNSSQPMYPTLFVLLLEIVAFATQAPTIDEPEAGPANRKKDWVVPSPAPFSEKCLECVVDLYRACAANESVIQDHVFFSIVKTLHLPLKVKYGCQRQTTWKLAINSLIRILEVGLPVAYKDTRSELFHSMWEELAATFEDFLFATSNPPDTQTMDDHLSDEQLDLKVLKVIREDILTHSHIVPRDFLSRIMTLLNKGSIHSATTSTLEGLDGSKFPLREEFAKSCFGTLLEFSFSTGDGKEVQKEAKVSQLAIDSLLGRCKEVLSKYTEDDKLGGKCPLPRTRMAEVTFVIKAMATLVSSLKKTSNSPSNACKVDPKLWSQVVEIYPCLVDCITCSSDAVRDALKQTLFEFKDLLLHEPNSKLTQSFEQ